MRNRAAAGAAVAATIGAVLSISTTLVKELLIQDFTPKNTQNELHKLVFDQAYRNAMLQGYVALKTELGTTIASDTAAHAMITFLQKVKRG